MKNTPLILCLILGTVITFTTTIWLAWIGFIAALASSYALGTIHGEEAARKAFEVRYHKARIVREDEVLKL